MEHIVSAVAPGSIAEELEIEPGDVLVSVNGQEPEDVFDYLMVNFFTDQSIHVSIFYGHFEILHGFRVDVDRSASNLTSGNFFNHHGG